MTWNNELLSSSKVKMVDKRELNTSRDVWKVSKEMVGTCNDVPDSGSECSSKFMIVIFKTVLKQKCIVYAIVKHF